jgi:hypothetical protein
VSAVIHLLTSRDFLFGVLAGLAGVALLVALRRRRLDWGLVWGAAVMGGLVLTTRSGWLAFGLASNGNPWAIPAAIGAAAAAFFGLREAKDTTFSGLATAISIAGIWATVPETDRISVIVGVTAVMVWVWWPLDLSSPRVAGAVVIGAFAAWAVLIGGIPRATGLIGGFGAIASLWVSARFVPREQPWIWVAIHFLLVLAWSRWAGLSDTVPVALLIGLGASLAAAVAGRLLARRGLASGA